MNEKNNEIAIYECKLCDISFSKYSFYTNHLKGKKHRIKIDELVIKKQKNIMTPSEKQASKRHTKPKERKAVLLKFHM